MLTKCRLTHRAKVAIQAALQAPSGQPIHCAELEFKELPYFLVSRSRAGWNTEEKGNINEILLENVSERVLIVDPDVNDNKCRRTLVPWANVISISVVYGGEEEETDKA